MRSTLWGYQGPEDLLPGAPKAHAVLTGRREALCTAQCGAVEAGGRREWVTRSTKNSAFSGGSWASPSRDNPGGTMTSHSQGGSPACLGPWGRYLDPIGCSLSLRALPLHPREVSSLGRDPQRDCWGPSFNGCGARKRTHRSLPRCDLLPFMSPQRFTALPTEAATGHP